ncbi:MAG: IPT/TIG domain-containing protein, partial [Candidatus Methanoperedens sp.]|nr:IPT/TIG domain-containing protein [Candidatus Methanoperedens sp.]
MKNFKIVIPALLLFAVLVGIGIAAIPAPPVNQNLGFADTKFVNVSVDHSAPGSTAYACKDCHPGAPDIHHYMVSGGPGSNMTRTTALGCADCHPIVGGQLTISRNCHDCHDGTVWSGNPTGIINLSKIRGSPGRPHHNTTKKSASSIFDATYVAADRQCTFCHGDGYLDNYNDGHYVPTYNGSMVTPMADFKVNDSGKLWGGCLACHDDGTEQAYGVFNSDTTHHTVRFWIGYQCNNCHVSSGFRAEPVPDYNPEPQAQYFRVWYNESYPSYTTMFGWDTTKRHFELRNATMINAGDTLNGTGCEKCHSVRDLHNIETASPGRNLSQTLADEIPGYGHIGNNSDCNGCHQGWAGSVDNPFPGPKAMSIGSVAPGVLTADVATDVTITGSNFVEDPYTTTVLVDGVSTALTSITETSIVVNVNLAAGAHTIVVQKDVATTPLTTVMAVAPGTISSAKLSGTTLTIDGAGLGADQTMVVI